MLETKQPVDLVGRLIEEHSESRKRIACLKARLEAVSVALDLAAVNVEYAIRGVENPGMEQVFRDIPSPETVLMACTEYRCEVERSLELAAALAERGEWGYLPTAPAVKPPRSGL
jgi:hypothetical protein